MPQLVITIAKIFGVWFAKKMLLKLTLDLVEEAMEKGAAKSEYKWDDNLVAEFKKNREDLEKLINSAV